MANNYTLYEKAAIFDMIHSYFTDPIGRDDSRIEQELEEVRVENAKLRELCNDLWSVMWACAEQRCQHRHKDCFVVNGNGDGPKGNGECWYKLRMRELGIEV